ncbi:Orotate phosphoribosyltransferase [Collimonas arenae]|uniref:Orotate phosphoribosyltransferase n=1 Tax=Collimonas arenae TaxID=279058 RepID=A0A0A1FA78_9BURK|nr:hypothetical protein [Collimonas arenae]AIY41643.1 Orotate phosphoribosyltransferase [Collimonas arenae]
MNDKREALAEHLREHGILVASAEQPIRHRDGTLAPWAFYSWNSTLTEEGLRLAALCILDRLKGFRSTQLATVGYTGMPLLSACVLLGEGRYTGLCIREQRKTYVSCRRIEGPFDKHAPVVIIDDSISSGTSLGKAIRAIEDEGAEVEGAIVLAQFPHRGGFDWANANGYRTEAIFDIWSDLGMAHTLPHPLPPYAPPTGSVPAPEGLHPAALARFAATTYLTTGVAPLAPRSMDRSYEDPGGVFVSFRERANEHRIARSGFWHFNPAAAQPCSDVIAATIDTLCVANGQITIQNLAQLKIAVSFFSALESIAPRYLDFDRYGIVAQSRVFPMKRGGALPNTEVFISDVEQYRHARKTNAGIVRNEPHDIFRHDVHKYIEPGESWLPYGTRENDETSWWRNAALGHRLVAFVRGLLAQALTPGSVEPADLQDSAIPCAIAGVAVRLYHSGLIGYGLCNGPALGAGLREAVAQVLADPRLKRESRDSRELERNTNLASCTIVVSVLHHPEPLGAAPISMVARKLRRGLDALCIDYAGRTTILLPSALPYNNLSREAFVRTTAQLAHAETAAETRQAEWRTLQCAEWTEFEGRGRPMRFGFPDRSADDEKCADAAALIRLLGSYIAGSLDVDGMPRYLLLPVSGEAQARGTAARAIHALMALDLAGSLLNERTWCNAAQTGLRHCLVHVRDGALILPGWTGGSLADAVLLRAVADHPALSASAAALSIARRLSGMLRVDGRIGRPIKRLDLQDDHEYFPGATLAALGRFAIVDPTVLPASLDAQISWYAHRFNTCPSWGSAGWLPQGLQALHRITADPKMAELAFKATDWGIQQQLVKNGAFLEDLSPDEPSFNTGFIAEGVAASRAIALDIGDSERAARYAASWSDAMRFMSRLIVFPEDVFAMPVGLAAVGGVRCTLSRSDIRIDQVSHCLHALVEGARLEQLMLRNEEIVEYVK